MRNLSIDNVAALRNAAHMVTVPHVDSQPVVTGLDLKLRRTAARVTQIDLGAQMGVTPQRVSHIEALAVVPPTAAERYVAALAAVASNRESA